MNGTFQDRPAFAPSGCLPAHVTLAKNALSLAPITAPNAARATFVRCLAGTAHGDLWSEKSFAGVSEVAGNSRIKM